MRSSTVVETSRLSGGQFAGLLGILDITLWVLYGSRPLQCCSSDFEIGSSLYRLGIGQGDSEKAAAELARADLIKQIQEEMRVTWSDFIRERGGTTEQEVSRLVETNVAELVRGIEIVEQARDAGASYAVAVLPKAEVSRIFESAKAQNEV